MTQKPVNPFEPLTHNIRLNTSVTPQMRKQFRTLTDRAVETPLTRNLQNLYNLMLKCEVDSEELEYLFENHFEVIEAATCATIASYQKEEL